MTPLTQIRALYRANKARTIRKDVVAAVRRAKADTRAREMIERWQAGETHSQIADALGVTRCCVTRAISRYRERHPEIELRAPLSAQRKGAGSDPRSAPTISRVNTHAPAHTGFVA